MHLRLSLLSNWGDEDANIVGFFAGRNLPSEDLLSNLKEYMVVSADRYSDSGPVAAKFVETLQRSNEQLVKLATLVYKKDIFIKKY